MPIRFRRTVRILPGVRLNLSQNGASVTVGKRGSSVTAGPTGTYANVGLPGSGLSYRTRLDAPAPASLSGVDFSSRHLGQVSKDGLCG